MFATNALQLATGALSCDNYGQPSMAIQLMVACIADPAHVCLLPTPPPLFSLLSIPHLLFPTSSACQGTQDRTQVTLQPSQLISDSL